MGKTKDIRNDVKDKYIIVGIDPGISPGWGVVQHCTSLDDNDNRKLLAHGKLESDTAWDIATRLDYINIRIIQIILKWKPECIYIEELNTSFGRKKGGRTINRRDLQIYSAAWGTIYAATLHVHEGDTQILKIKDKPSKEMARLYVKNKFGIERISNDAAEAITWACDISLASEKEPNH